MTSLEARFWAALRRLESWHSDSLKAQSFDGPQTSPTKPGSIVLRATPYPHFSYWTNEWRKARSDEEREEVIRGLNEEWEELGMAPSLKYRFSQGTLEWKAAIGTFAGTAQQAARLYGVSQRTVFRYRKEYSRSS